MPFAPLRRGRLIVSLVVVVVVVVAFAVVAVRSVADEPGATPVEGLADTPVVLTIWPGGAPGGDPGAEGVGEEGWQNHNPKNGVPVDRLQNVTKPTLTFYAAPKDKNTGTTVIICPGGGYNILAWNLEGTEVAAWLNSIGVNAAVLKYRVPRRKHQPSHVAPLQDAQRAIRMVRERAADWGIATDRIGILGFSAGGHLAAAASTNFDKNAYEPIDDTDKLSARPDFTVLIYPAYLTAEKGNAEKLAPEIAVTKATPPAIAVMTQDDGIGVECAIAYYLALKRAKVPAELHLYPSGGHGYGLRKSGDTVCTWPDRVRDWLESRGLLKKP